MIINLSCASVDDHIPRDDIFDYHPRRECNLYIIFQPENICYDADWKLRNNKIKSTTLSVFNYAYGLHFKPSEVD